MIKNIFLLLIIFTSIKAAAQFTIDIGPDTTVCIGSCITIDTKLPDTLIYQWVINNITVGEYSDSPKITFCAHELISKIQVSASDIEDESGNLFSGNKNIYSMLPPGVLDYKAYKKCLDSCVELSGPYGLNKVDAYKWTPSDGLDDTTSPNPLCCIGQPTEYIVSTFYGSDSGINCVQKDTLFIDIDDCGKIDSGFTSDFNSDLTKDYLSFRLDMEGLYIKKNDSKQLKIRLCNYSGQCLKEEFFTDTILRFDTDKLSSGIYIISLAGEDGLLRSYKFFKY